ncbi:transcriptional regulator, GntR family [Musicola paradisiaca Ech703]|uniref:Transcriptional regulator, GntR family n=2 Tax=Musicola paradisiaca TaxID=69223 RepID=C6CCW9_MUSP7|nr:transcriptional regulator, GntR family [Musicola paradisiaca Ech703]
MLADTMMTLTPLQARIVRALITHIRREKLAVGHHLAESVLAQALGTSRTPVKQVMQYLMEKGVVIYDRNRGFFLAQHAEALRDLLTELLDQAEDPLYLQLVEWRVTRQLPEQFSETELLLQLEVKRPTLHKALLRCQQEGWLEHLAGQGWRSLPVIDSVAAYEESFALRTIIEPAALLTASFHIEPQQLAACRQQQEYLAEEGYLTMTPLEMFETNAGFHELLAQCSGNRFLLQTVRHLTRLRKLVGLVEYRQEKFRPQRKHHAQEHLQIIHYLECGDRLSAADFMRVHLEKARRQKVIAELFVAHPTP